jgi:cell division protein FtsA
MFDSSPIIVGLEIGTSKICAVVGEINDAGAPHIIGVGQAKSRGVRKGEIVDTSLAEEDVRNAIVDAENMADVEVSSVFLGVTGSHIKGLDNRGVHNVLSPNRDVSEDDVQDVIKNAKAINLPVGNHVVHPVRQHFIVDGQGDIADPIGMLGTRLEVDLHVIHGNFNRLQNPIRLVKGLQLEVETIAFNGLASALALLNHEQKELGALVIDMGAGSTEYILYANGIIKHSGVLAVGGDHITNDLAIGLKLPLSRAEQLKMGHGRALVDDSIKSQTITLISDTGLPEKPVNLEHLRKIMNLRLEETFELIQRNLAEANLLHMVRSGVFICGGCARIPEIQQLAERIFAMPACLGKSGAMNGNKSALDQPEFATGIGLVKYGAMQVKQRQAQRSFGWGIRSTLTQIFRRNA